MTEVDDWHAQVRRGVLELCVLALLEREPSYGYEILTQLNSAGRLAAGEGTVYPLLRRLKQLGWVETYWQESTAGPPRQYYRLTAAGATHLDALRREWNALAGAVAGFLDRSARR